MIDRLNELTMTVVSGLIGKSLLPRAQRIIDGIEYKYPDDFADRFLDGIAGGAIPVLAGSHQSHFDVFGLAGVVNKTNRLLGNRGMAERKFYLPAARSMWTGHQGMVVKAFQESMVKRVAEDNIVMFPITRKKDEKYGLSKRNPEMIKVIRQTITGTDGMALFPEGTMAGGRTKHKFGWDINNINGMQFPSEHLIDGLVRTASKSNREVMVVPMGIHGGYRSFTPNWSTPTVRALWVCYAGGRIAPVQVNVGLPILVSEIKEQLKTSDAEYPIEDLVMRRIAQLQPEWVRGVYR